MRILFQGIMSPSPRSLALSMYRQSRLAVASVRVRLFPWSVSSTLMSSSSDRTDLYITSLKKLAILGPRTSCVPCIMILKIRRYPKWPKIEPCKRLGTLISDAGVCSSFLISNPAKPLSGIPVSFHTIAQRMQRPNAMAKLEPLMPILCDTQQITASHTNPPGIYI